MLWVCRWFLKGRWNVQGQLALGWLAAAPGYIERLLHHDTRMGLQDPVEESPGWVNSKKDARHRLNASYSHLVVDGDSTPLALACHGHDALHQYSAGLVGIPA
jgi:hypothetical protein